MTLTLTRIEDWGLRIEDSRPAFAPILNPQSSILNPAKRGGIR
jgi:hypothetical protein